VASISPEVTSDESCERVPAAAAEHRRRDVRSTEPDELLVRVDLVAVAGRERPRGADRFPDREKDDSAGAREQEREVEEPDRGQARGRDRRFHGPDHVDAVEPQVEHGNRGDPDDDRDQRGGESRPDPAHQEDERERGAAHRERPAVRLRDGEDHRRELLERARPAGLEPEQLGQLADDDRDREPDHEARDDGCREEIGDEPETCQPGKHEDRTDHQREPRGQLEVPPRVAGRERADQRRGHDRHRRAGRHLEVAAGPEHGVREQGGERGDEAELSGDPSERGVAHRDRDHDGPRRQSGDQIEAGGSARVGAPPRREGDVGGEPRSERHGPVASCHPSSFGRHRWEQGAARDPSPASGEPLRAV
jgi:hypothetical protein